MELFFLKLSIILVPGLMAITCHEVSHGFVADRLGDKTARYMGRLTLNPLRHLDLVGTFMLIFTLYVFKVGIGWAKPVPVNFNNLRHPKRDMIWVAAAGPTTNFLLATLSALAIRGLMLVGTGIPAFFTDPLLMMLFVSVFINLILGGFNLIPIPPLDGGRVMVGLLPYRQSVAYARIEPIGMLIIIALIVLFPGILNMLIAPLLDTGLGLLLGPDVLTYLHDATSLARLGLWPF